MKTPLFAVIAVILSIGSFTAGRATAPVTSPKADITQSQRTVTPVHVQKPVQNAAKKAPNHRIVKKAKPAKKHALPQKKGKVTHLTKVTTQPHKTAKFDCGAIPHIAYQYPAKTVINAASEYLPKSSLSKLRYCLEKGESG